MTSKNDGARQRVRARAESAGPPSSSILTWVDRPNSEKRVRLSRYKVGDSNMNILLNLPADSKFLLLALDHAVAALGKTLDPQAKAAVEAHGFNPAFFTCDIFHDEVVLSFKDTDSYEIRISKVLGVRARCNFAVVGSKPFGIARNRAATQLETLNRAIKAEEILVGAFKTLGEERFQEALTEVHKVKQDVFAKAFP